MIKLYEQTEQEKLLDGYIDKVDKVWRDSKKELQAMMRGKQSKAALGLLASKTITADEAANLSRQQLKTIMVSVKDGISELSAETVKHAEILGWEAQQLAGLVERVGWQKKLADDVTKSVYDRLSNVFDAKYGSLKEYEQCMDRMWGSKKANLLDAFKDEIAGHVDGLVSGDLTSAAWERVMADTFAKQHEGIYTAARIEYGGAEDLTKENLNWLHKEIAEEQKYLKNFRADIDAADLANVSLDAIRARADLYAGKGNTLYQAGKTSAFEGQEVEIYWELGLPITEHCDDCPDLAANSPYTAETLPCFPGDGNTTCMTNCYCSLQYIGKNANGDIEFEEGEII